ncbi:MAG: extracellular solute-binding protein [Ruminococcus sp.]|nr:extracellular solute-binding protein [Ruminococcus sp.]
MQNTKNYQKLGVLILSLITLLMFINIVYTALISIQKKNMPVSESKTISILTWKPIPTIIIDGFHKQYPGYYLNIERYPKTNYISFLNSKLQTDASVDLVEIPVEFYKDYINSDSLTPVTNISMLSRFWNEPVDFLKSVSGTKEIYGIPYQSDFQEFWYNQAIFEKYDLDPPNSIPNFYKACEVLSQANIPPLAIGLSDCRTAQNFLSALISEPVLKGITADEKASITNAYQMLHKNYINDTLFSMSNEQAFAAFLDSSYAMAFTSEDVTSQLSDSIMQKIDIQVTGIYIQNEDQTYVMGSPVDSVLCISSHSSNQDMCREFLDYYTQYDTVKSYIDETKSTTNIQEYTINPSISKEWEKMRLSIPYPGWNNYHVSSFHSDNGEETLAQKLLCNIVTPDEYIQQIQSGGGKHETIR